MSEEELKTLNCQVVERIRMIHKAKAVARMTNFNIHDLVCFDCDGQKKCGTITKLNQRSISVKLDDGQLWRVSPHLLTRIING